MSFRITNELRPPIGRPLRRKSLDELVELSRIMTVGEAALLTNSQAQTFRVILAAQGFACVTDGYRSPDTPGSYPRRIWCFKLNYETHTHLPPQEPPAA